MLRKLLAPVVLVVGLLPLGAAAAEPAPAGTAATPAALPSAEDFARFSSYGSFKLSPDGRYLGVTRRSETQVSLVVVRLEDFQLVGSTQFTRGDVIHDFWWVSPTRLVIALATDNGPLDQPMPTGELFGVDYDGKNGRYLFGYRGRQETGTHIKAGLRVFGVATVEDPLQNDPDELLVMVRERGDEFPSLSRLNKHTGNLRPVARAPMRYPSRFLTDGGGQPKLVTGHEDNLDERVTLYRNAAGQWQPLRLEAAEAIPLAVSRDGRTATLRTESTKGRQCVIEVDLSVAEPATTARERLCRDEPGIEDVFFTAEHRSYAVRLRDEVRLTPIDSATREMRWLHAFEAQFPGQQVTPVSHDQAYDKVLLLVASDRNSGELYAMDMATGKARYLDALQTWIDPAQMAEVRRLQFKARDGQVLDGLLTLPPGKPAHALPLVVHPHGGPFGVRDAWGWSAEPQFLASRGYAVLQVNYRGSGGYGQAFRKAGEHEWGGRMINDITDGVRHLIAEGIVDAHRIGIFGGSYGGYAALMSAVREPALYRCAVGYAGVYDLVAMRRDTDVSSTRIGRRFLDATMGSDENFLREQSPITHLDALRGPVLIVHGEEDERAPYNQAKRLRSALDDRKLPYEWLVKPREGHGFYGLANRTELFEKLAAFFDRNLAAPH